MGRAQRALHVNFEKLTNRDNKIVYIVSRIKLPFIISNFFFHASKDHKKKVSLL